jgi:hypothetical protein
MQRDLIKIISEKVLQAIQLTMKEAVGFNII